MNPLLLFSQWYNEQLKLSKATVPSACCLSTIGTDGFPNARIVSLKEITEGSFVITGPLKSRKGLEINNSNKVALTFWWAEPEKQVRIQGEAMKIPGPLADKYFNERPVESQIVSLISQQGEEIESFEILDQKYREAKDSLSGKVISRPADWGAYFIKPTRIEFMEFKTSRLHDRTLYEIKNGEWIVTQLQP